MRYGRHKHKVSYALEDLQKKRELATDPVEIDQCQKDIDDYFFGSKKRRKSKKERRRERRKERYQEDLY